MLTPEPPHPTPAAEVGRVCDAYLLALGLPVDPAPWPEPTPEQVETARKVQTIPDTRRVQ